MNDIQKKILLRVASWAVKRQEAASIPVTEWGTRGLVADRAAFMARYEIERALSLLSEQDLRDLQEGLETLMIGGKP